MSSCTLCKARPTCRARSVSNRSSSSVKAAPSAGRSQAMSPSSSPVWAIGATRVGRGHAPGHEAGQPDVEPRPTRHARPADHHAFLLADEIRCQRAMRHHCRDLVVATRPGPDLRAAELHRLSKGLRQLQQQLVERYRAGQSHAPRAKCLVGRDTFAVHHAIRAFRQPCPSGLVGERCPSGGEHREQQQRALATRRFAPERRKRQQVCGHDQRRQSGECDRVSQQPIDAGEHARDGPDR